jgi:hypothetical protein
MKDEDSKAFIWKMRILKHSYMTQFVIVWLLDESVFFHFVGGMSTLKVKYLSSTIAFGIDLHEGHKDQGVT